LVDGAEINVLEGETSAAAAGVHLAGKGALVGGEGAAGSYGAGTRLYVAA